MRLLVFILAFLACLYSKANVPAISNTDSLKKPWHISHERFIDKFGNNDTSRALIEMWFKNRKAGIIVTAISASISGLLGIPFFKTAFGKPANPNAYAPVIGFSFGLLFSIFSLLTLVGLLKILRFSKKKLYKLLTIYQSGELLPTRIREKLGQYMGRKQRL